MAALTALALMLLRTAPALARAVLFTAWAFADAWMLRYWDTRFAEMTQDCCDMIMPVRDDRR